MKLNQTQGSIAYLAPEIPGKSSTFVYNEIIEVENLGIEVVPFSLHSVESDTANSRITSIAERCEYLYRIPAHRVLHQNFVSIYQSPVRYLRALGQCIIDATKCIRKPRTAIGLIFRFVISGYLAVQLRESNVRHLHSHFAHIATDIGMYAARQVGIPFSFTVHANDIFQRGYLLKEKGTRAKFIAAISNYNVGILESKGIPGEKVKLVRCGVDTGKFIPRERKIQRDKTKTIGFLGRLVEKKGLDILINAMRILIDERRSVRLEIMGSGPLEGALKAQVNALQLGDTVTFGGALSHEVVSDWFEKIDYFAFPGKVDQHGDMDGIPVVLMEAMMRGVPVIATSISGIPELVKDGETGRLSEPAAKDFAEAITAIISESEQETEEMVHRAIKLVGDEFNLKTNVEMLVAHMCVQGNTFPCPMPSHS